MSENTSDTAMGTSGMATGDNEPSMEDILASIRKIIADDKPQSEAPALVSEQDIMPQDVFAQAVGVDQPIAVEVESALESSSVAHTDDEDDILDLINFVEEPTPAEGGAAAQELLEETLLTEEPVQNFTDSLTEDLTIPEPQGAGIAEQSIDFDETLDLVVDSEASEYVTTTFDNAEAVTATADENAHIELREDVIETADIVGDVEPPQAEEFLDSEVEDIDILSELEPEEVVLEPSRTEYVETVEAEAVLEENTSQNDVVENIVGIEEPTARATPDEDMNLVKSLLADLMDEPAEAVETIGADDAGEDGFFIGDTEPVDTANVVEPESILEEIVEQTIDDELAINEELQALTPDVEDIQPSEADDSLEIIAQNTRETAREIQEPTVLDDDVVDLTASDMSDKFSLLKKVGAGVAVAGVGAAIISETVGREQEAELETADDAVDIEELLETQVSKTEPEPQSRQDTPTIEEEAIMAQATPTPSLVDEDTQTDSRNAFASLSTAVQEKTKLEESGPAIGDLVQEALKPMLKEWLDKNLKGIVERAVTKEVKRISAQK